MRRFILFFLAFISYSFVTHAQISGVVTDSKTGKTLSGVEIFINKTTVATQSDELGQFNLEGRVTGFQELVLFKEGYDLYRSPMKIQADRQYKLQLSLVPQKKKKSSPLSETESALLKDKLLSHISADSIAFLNIEQIRVVASGGPTLLAGPPMIVQNSKTGYKQYCYGIGLPFETIDQAPVRFESLVSEDVKQNIAWEQSRQNHFKGSVRHWLMATVANHLKEEDYSFKAANGESPDIKSFISASSLAGYFKLTIDQPLTVVYKDVNEKVRTSQIKTKGSVDVNTNGQMMNSKSLDVQGDMSDVTFADQLPIDYEPIAGDVKDVYAQAIERFYEKVYVHTDKPYYYPGEPMWFKGYINYKEPLWRDSLSKVMYVELINPKKEIALTKILKIDSGFFHNDFILPDTLKEGTYYLRAYTNLNRNFGEAGLFVKEISILNITDKASDNQEAKDLNQSHFLSITSSKLTYKPREKITLTVQTKGQNGNPLASNLSISVTDAAQVVSVPESTTIIKNYPLEENSTSKTLEISYPVEYGVGFKGRFLNDKNKPEKTTLTLLQMKTRSMMMSTTDDLGVFIQTGLDFYDTATFSYRSEKAKDLPYGRIELLPRETPPLIFNKTVHSIAVKKTESQQRIISEYEVPKDVRMLEGVEVKATRIEEQYEQDYRVKRPYGKPDYVLKAKDINTSYGNLLLAIQGRFPGLIVRLTEGGSWVVYSKRGELSSISNAKEVTVMLNDVPLGGTPESSLLSINPATVESIEFTNKVNVLYGSFGGFGVLSIYTKKGVSEEVATKSNLQIVKVPGYSSTREFRSPDYESGTDKTSTDYRSTIYWNPNLKANSRTGQNTVSFFAADLPGKYRIVVEGVLENGEPVRGEYFINIERN